MALDLQLTAVDDRLQIGTDTGYAGHRRVEQERNAQYEQETHDGSYGTLKQLRTCNYGKSAIYFNYERMANTANNRGTKMKHPRLAFDGGA